MEPEVQNLIFVPVGLKVKVTVKVKYQIMSGAYLCNASLPDGILMKLGTGILLMDLKCRTQLSALTVKGQGHSQGRMSNRVQSITLQCLMGF